MQEQVITTELITKTETVGTSWNGAPAFTETPVMPMPAPKTLGLGNATPSEPELALSQQLQDLSPDEMEMVRTFQYDISINRRGTSSFMLDIGDIVVRLRHTDEWLLGTDLVDLCIKYKVKHYDVPCGYTQIWKYLEIAFEKSHCTLVGQYQVEHRQIEVLKDERRLKKDQYRFSIFKLNMDRLFSYVEKLKSERSVVKAP